MSILKRGRPAPIPAIHPMPEYLASGQRGEWYEDTKQVLQVPWDGCRHHGVHPLPNLFR